MSSVLERCDMGSSQRLSRRFLICDFCFWCASAIRNKRDDIASCPRCRRAISEIPLADTETFTFNYDRKRGVELAFASPR
ncbi:MAG TPA: hypothetical protein VIB07_09370 [Nitrososphaera sp.]